MCVNGAHDGGALAVVRYRPQSYHGTLHSLGAYFMYGYGTTGRRDSTQCRAHVTGTVVTEGTTYGPGAVTPVCDVRDATARLDVGVRTQFVTPEPAAYALLGTGLATLGLIARCRRTGVPAGTA